ncbi:hypothetical protein M404DRAFT_521707 [Pisolithus tinctorius Marx 270]|uniref:Uncharacterized protein n=1 Tax=Pisolithus tinctorius Marx 270 TaxID=870435 RepID=A0A0C3PCC0_PISTI|nr:hypothetical protein M404DRAFT_521707 [Pisolithus tinctorius Marx 270]
MIRLPLITITSPSHASIRKTNHCHASGKPHPRWADASAGDPSERWHSRAAKNGLQLRRARASSGLLPADNNGINGQQVKPEPLPAEISQPHLYRFTPSPPAPTAYNATGFSPSSSSSLYHPHSNYHQQHGTSYDNGLWCDADNHPQQRQYTFPRFRLGFRLRVFTVVTFLRVILRWRSQRWATKHGPTYWRRMGEL